MNVGDVLTVTASSAATVRVVEENDPARASPNATVNGAKTVFGPYGSSKLLLLSCTGGTAQYDLTSAVASRILFGANAPVDADGFPDGTIYIQTA